jgi:hypothetical protein
MEALKYHIGKFERPPVISEGILAEWIADISSFPARLKDEVGHLTDEQLDTPYRPGGWTIRQVVHHCADSHMNSFTRLKLALTEDQPTINPYFEDRWAELGDARKMPVGPALKMIEGIHERWVFLLNSLSEAQLARMFIHPEHGETFRVDENTGAYAWHCNHHLAHIRAAKRRADLKKSPFAGTCLLLSPYFFERFF